MMNIPPSLPEGTKLNPGSLLRFVCDMRGHIVAAGGVHGRSDDYDLCARCGLRQTWGDETDAWKDGTYWYWNWPWWWHSRTIASGRNPHPRSRRWWDQNA